MDYISQLIDYYHVPYELAFSDTLSYQELFQLALNHNAYQAYSNHIQDKAMKKQMKK